MLFLNFGLTSTLCAVQSYNQGGTALKAWNGQNEKESCYCVIGAALRSGCSPTAKVECYTSGVLPGRWKETKMGVTSVWTVDANGNGKRVGPSYTISLYNDMTVSLTMMYKYYQGHGYGTQAFCNQIDAKFYFGGGNIDQVRAVIINPNLIRFTRWRSDFSKGYDWVRVDN
jgi:hypothetical protein